VELLLNGLWLTLGVGALLLWMRQCRRAGSARKLAAGCVALACISILLFPIISATDDSQALAQTGEQPGAKRVAADALSVLCSLAWIADVPSSAVSAERVPCDSFRAYSFLQTVQITNRPPPSC
jgi:hypothetical protein